MVERKRSRDSYRKRDGRDLSFDAGKFEERETIGRPETVENNVAR